MSLSKYQVHDETSQVSYTTSSINEVWIALTTWVGFYVSCFQIQLFTHCFLLLRYFCMYFCFYLFKNKKNERTHVAKKLLSCPSFCYQPNWLIGMLFYFKLSSSCFYAMPTNLVGTKRFK